jgi:hypothetical protein
LQQAESLKLDTLSFNEAIAALYRYSLIKKNDQEKTLSMHRLVSVLLIAHMLQFAEALLACLPFFSALVFFADFLYAPRISISL